MLAVGEKTPLLLGRITALGLLQLYILPWGDQETQLVEFTLSVLSHIFPVWDGGGVVFLCLKTVYVLPPLFPIPFEHLTEYRHCVVQGPPVAPASPPLPSMTGGFSCIFNEQPVLH